MGEQGNELIVDTYELAEMLGEDEVQENLEATTKSDPDAKIEFHVQMRAWTQRDMEELVIEAAARQLVGRNAGDGALAKAVQEAAIRQITARADEKLASVAADIIDQPVLVGPISSKEPVTLREMIGLYAKEYLTEKVGSDGKPDDSYYARDRNKARITWIVERALDSKFKTEIEKATNAAIREIQAAIHEQHKALLAAETARLREALAKVTGGAQ
jgi:hypothetical protein